MSSAALPHFPMKTDNFSRFFLQIVFVKQRISGRFFFRDGPLLSILPLPHPPVGNLQESHFVGLAQMINVTTPLVPFNRRSLRVRWGGGDGDRCRSQNGGKSEASGTLLTPIQIFEK